MCETEPCEAWTFGFDFTIADSNTEPQCKHTLSQVTSKMTLIHVSKSDLVSILLCWIEVVCVCFVWLLSSAES